MKKIAFLGILALLVTVALLPVFAEQSEITVYTALQENDMKVLAPAFEKATGIKLNYVVVGGAGQVETRIEAEAANPQADIDLGGSSEFHQALAAKGILLKYISPNDKYLGKVFVDPNGYWHGIWAC
jgi:iron(III) transport system substrate-binding protein